MDQEFKIGDVVAIVKRRFLYLLVPFVVLFSATIAVAVLLPPTYQSSGLILIESPKISDEIVAGSVASAARERIEVIRQRVMTRGQLLELARQFSVFTKRDGAMSASETVSAMRELAAVEYISTGTSRRNQTTVAFRVSFDHRDPRTAARVANELVTLFMDQNVKTRTKIASETTEFLEKEAEKLERTLSEIEDRIARYKQANSSALPESLDLRIDMRERIQGQIQELARERKTYQEELRFLDIQLSAAKAALAAPDGGEEVIDVPRDERVVELAKKYAKLSGDLTVYSESHPDIKALKREIESLEASLIAEGGRVAKETRQAKLEHRIRTVERGSDGEVSQADLDAMKSELAQLTKDLTKTAPQDQSENLAKYNVSNIQTKMSVAQERIRSLEEQRTQLEQRLQEIEQSIIETPEVDRVLRTLNRDYENAQRKYNEIRSKAMQAQISENVEEASKAERFVLVEPPSVPDEPLKPNRLLVLAMGFAASIGAGGAAIFGMELIDGTIRGTGTLAALTNVMPLAVVPYIVTNRERRAWKRRKILISLLLILATIGTLAALHFLYMPLDTLIYKIYSRFG